MSCLSMLDTMTKALKFSLTGHHIHVSPEKALENLTPEMAAKIPADGEHSCWGILHHIVYWQDLMLEALRRKKEVDWPKNNLKSWPEDIEPNEKEWKELICAIAVPSIDIEGLDRVEFEIDVIKSDSPEPGYLRFTFADKFNQDRFAVLELDPEKKHYSIPARDVYGFFLDDDLMASMTISFNRQPWFYPIERLKSEELVLDVKSIKIVGKEKPR